MKIRCVFGLLAIVFVTTAHAQEQFTVPFAPEAQETIIPALCRDAMFANRVQWSAFCEQVIPIYSARKTERETRQKVEAEAREKAAADHSAPEPAPAHE